MDEIASQLGKYANTSCKRQYPDYVGNTEHIVRELVRNLLTKSFWVYSKFICDWFIWNLNKVLFLSEIQLSFRFFWSYYIDRNGVEPTIIDFSA